MLSLQKINRTSPKGEARPKWIIASVKSHCLHLWQIICTTEINAWIIIFAYLCEWLKICGWSFKTRFVQVCPRQSNQVESALQHPENLAKLPFFHEFRWEENNNVFFFFLPLNQKLSQVFIAKQEWDYTDFKGGGGGQNDILWHDTKTNRTNRKAMFGCLLFSVHAEIKGWKWICIEAFGSLSRRVLRYHGNACWTKVPWMFQYPPSLFLLLFLFFLLNWTTWDLLMPPSPPPTY